MFFQTPNFTTLFMWSKDISVGGTQPGKIPVVIHLVFISPKILQRVVCDFIFIETAEP